jgi:CCR4-NOT transcription complex subunit 6
VEAVYSPIDRKDWGLISQQSLPNERYPSDHLPIGAVLVVAPFGAEPRPLR